MKLRLLAVSAVLIALVGCGGGGPSPEAIQKSMQEQGRAQLRQAEQMAVSMGASAEMMRSMGQPAPEELSIENVEILESQKLDNGDYQVNMSVDVVMKDQRQTRTLDTLVKDTDSGCKVIMPGGY